ncbi:MAG TPA: hypothetical protein VKP30_13995, partial [Polyangiaceae bacterium]|nr:hypothetical protein [Polyangiaceae bacterium]
TGRLPFNEATPQATVLAVIGTEPPKPRELVPTIPESTEQIILRAMAKQPEARYQSMSEFLTALESESKDTIVRYDGKSSVRDSLDTQSERGRTARPRLVLILGLALGLLLGSAAVAIAGLEQAAGWALTRLELGLLLLCGAAVAVTPVVLVARWIRRRVWDDGKRVVELSSAARTAVVTAVATYGLGWLASRVFDGVALRLMGKPVQVDLSWPGWDFLLTLIGVGAGVVALLRERALTDALSGWRRAVVATLALLATLSLAGFIIPVGLRWQEQQTSAARSRSRAATKARRSSSKDATPQPTPSAPPIVAPALSQLLEAVSQPEPAATTAPQEPNQPPLSQSDSAPISSATTEIVPPPTPAPAAPSASEEELRAAAARGVEGWVSLAETYPNDPRVLRPLVLGHASRAAELGKAMSAARRLFQAAPQETASNDLQYLIVRAAESRGEPADLAWKMLAEDMGTVGADLLYSMTLTKPRLADRAEQLLASPAMATKISPALGIARELRQASSCAQRLPLLERAVEVGDERAIMALGALSTGASKGCGKNKRKACLPACPEQAEQFRSAMNRISSRLKAARN